jgi:transposase
VQNDTRIAVDIAKAVFEIALSQTPGRVSKLARLRRTHFLEFFAQQPPATVVMEACGSAHYLGRISKRGDGYLRMLLIHGARSLIHHAKRQQQDRLRAWAHELSKTHVHNKAAVAVANKLARIVWAVWTRQQPYQELRPAA